MPPRTPAKAKAKAKAKAQKPSTRKATAAIDYSKLGQDYQQSKGGDWWKMTKEKHKICPVPFEHAGRIHVFAEDSKYFELLPDHKILPVLPGCPMLKVLQSWKPESQEEKDLKSKLRPTTRYCMNIVDVEKNQNQILKFRSPFGIWDPIMKTVLDTEDYPGALDPNDSVVFIIEREGTARSTRYSCKPSPKRVVLELEGTPTDMVDLCNRPMTDDKGKTIDLKYMESIAQQVINRYDLDV